MKKLLLSAGLSISSSCFSFYRMEEIYCDPIPHQETSVIYSLSDWEKLDKDSTVSFFLYEKNTQIQLHYRVNLKELYQTNYEPNFLRPSTGQITIKEDLALPKPNILKFLNCNFSYNDNFFDIGNIRDIGKGGFVRWSPYYRKQPLIFKENSLIERKSPDFRETLVTIELTENLLSHSKVKITNTENGVNLSKEDKKDNIPVDMTAALRSYFVKASEPNEVADSIAHYHSDLSAGYKAQKKLLDTFNLKNRKILDKKNYELLKRSTILAIWVLVPQEKKDDNGSVHIIESEMIGLACDEDTKELYHFATDLGQDMSVLMNYKEKSVESK